MIQKIKEIIQQYLAELEVHAELENTLWKKYYNKLKELLDEVYLLNVNDNIINVGRKVVNNREFIFIYNIPERRLEVFNVPLINLETTPFTYEVVQNIDWSRIRPTWALHVHDFIFTLAEAELSGNLTPVIEEVEEKLRARMWVYEFQIMLRVLEKVKKKVKKRVNKTKNLLSR